MSKLDLHPYHALSIATKWHTTDTDGSEANSANKLSTVRDMTPGSCSVPILTGSWICRGSITSWKHRGVNEAVIRNRDNKVSHGFLNGLPGYHVLPCFTMTSRFLHTWGPLACFLPLAPHLLSLNSGKLWHIQVSWKLWHIQGDCQEHSCTVMPGCHQEGTIIESPNLQARIMVKVFPAPVEP